MTLWDRVRARLLNDRGDADPTLTVVSMFVAAVVSTLVVGILIIVIQASSNIVVENIRATALATAQKAWSQDANNASLVVQEDSTQVAFYEIPGRAPGVYIQRAGVDADYCRKSIWTVNGSEITNRVQQWDNDVCDLDDPLLAPDRDSLVMTLDGVVGEAGIVSENAAGRDLYFVEGEEVGLVAGTPQPSTNARASWWRDYEWAYTQPRKINLSNSVDLPLSGVAESTLRGSTWIVTTNEGDTITAPEEEPEVVQYTPGALSGLTVTRSSTLGDVYAFVREGINVSFNGVSCGPYSVEYTVQWEPITPGAVVRQAQFTAFGQPAPVDLDRVPNGSEGVVIVTAECPPSVSTDVASISESYTQPLPGPTLTGRIGAAPHLHELNWTAISSLPVEYRSEVDLGSGFSAQDRSTPNPTQNSSANLAWDEGSTYGVSHNYRVIGVLGSVEGSPSNTVELFSPWPTISDPILDGTPNGLIHDVEIQPFTCPAGTTTQYRQRVEINDAGFQGWSAWSTNPLVQHLMEQGQKADFEGEVRCYFDDDQFSNPSDPGTLTWVQPITDPPNPPSIVFTNPPAQDDPTVVSYIAVGCPPQTRPEYRTRYLLDTGTMGPWSGWSETPSTTVQMWFGQQIQIDVQARCLTDFTDDPKKGPPAETPGTFIRPIPAPVPPTNIRNDAGGTSAPVNNRVLYDAVDCWTGTTPQYRRDHVGVSTEAGYTTALTLNVATNWGTTYNYRAAARCVSAYAVSPDSAWSNTTTWTTNTPPVSTPWISVPASAFTNEYFTVAAGGAGCAAGSTTVWSITTPGYSWTTSSFSDYWSTVGFRTYTARAACAGPNAQGPWSAPASDGINIVAPPAPGNPGGVGARWASGSMDGGSIQGSWSAVGGATTYESQAVFFRGPTSTTSPVRTSGSAGTQSFTDCSGSPITGAQFRVRAGNSTGWSSWVTVTATRDQNINTCA